MTSIKEEKEKQKKQNKKKKKTKTHRDFFLPSPLFHRCTIEHSIHIYIFIYIFTFFPFSPQLVRSLPPSRISHFPATFILFLFFTSLRGEGLHDLIAHTLTWEASAY